MGGGDRPFQLILELSQIGAEQFFLKLGYPVPVVVSPGHGIHDVVTEGVQVLDIDVGVTVLVLVMAAAGCCPHSVRCPCRS